jgi:DHA2 family multidrug resistance protein
MRAKFNTEAPFQTLALPQLIQGIGVACFFVPLTSIALSGLPAEQIASASGLFNFLRILAGGVGTSIATTMWDRREALHHAQLTERITAFNPLANHALAQAQSQGLSAGQSYGLIERLIGTQAYAMATVDMSWIAGWIFLALIPLLWIARPPFGQGAVAAE